MLTLNKTFVRLGLLALLCELGIMQYTLANPTHLNQAQAVSNIGGITKDSNISDEEGWNFEDVEADTIEHDGVAYESVVKPQHSNVANSQATAPGYEKGLDKLGSLKKGLLKIRKKSQEALANASTDGGTIKYPEVFLDQQNYPIKRSKENFLGLEVFVFEKNAQESDQDYRIDVLRFSGSSSFEETKEFCISELKKYFEEPLRGFSETCSQVISNVDSKWFNIKRSTNPIVPHMSVSSHVAPGGISLHEFYSYFSEDIEAAKLAVQRSVFESNASMPWVLDWVVNNY